MATGSTLDAFLDGRYPVLLMCCKLKSQPHKQHIWFLTTHKPTQKKPKELFFANARQKKQYICK